MKQISFLLIALFLFSWTSFADDYEKGLAAFKKGDYKTAIEIWEPLAKKGDVGAQYNLGQMKRNGLGVPKNYEQALYWYRKASAKGDPDAQYNLGLMHYLGHGVKKDPFSAVGWFKKAANQGNVNAQSNLGAMYGEGEGVPKDYPQSYMWFSLAAESGDQNAQAAVFFLSREMSISQMKKGQSLILEWKESFDKK